MISNGIWKIKYGRNGQNIIKTFRFLKVWDIVKLWFLPMILREISLT
jgi:hypothetical protein